MEKNDKLETIFALQRMLNEDITRLRGLDGITYEEWIQKYTLAIISELSELLCEVNFKWWKNKKPLDNEAIREELVDILHFLISMCIRSGMSAEDLYNGYIEKNQENFDRQYGKSNKEGYAISHANDLNC